METKTFIRILAAGEQIDKAVEKAGDKINDAADKLKK